MATDNREPFKYNCFWCAERFRRPHLFIRHLLGHEEDPNFMSHMLVCTGCGTRKTTRHRRDFASHPCLFDSATDKTPGDSATVKDYVINRPLLEVAVLAVYNIGPSAFQFVVKNYDLQQQLRDPKRVEAGKLGAQRRAPSTHPRKDPVQARSQTKAGGKDKGDKMAEDDDEVEPICYRTRRRKLAAPSASLGRAASPLPGTSYSRDSSSSSPSYQPSPSSSSSS